MDRSTSIILLLIIICYQIKRIRADTAESGADTMADSMMARILQMCDPTKLDGRDISRSLMTPLLSIPENMMKQLNGRASIDLMGMMFMFNPAIMAEGNAKTIQECMAKGADISDLCARMFGLFHCVYEQNMAALG